MNIDFFFDTTCPWCFIGKRRLTQALETRPGIQPRLRWRPFLLNPDMPTEGLDRGAYVERKFGGTRRAQRVFDAARNAGRLVGLDLRFEYITRTPNTLDSHRLIRLGPDQATRDALLERVFAAFFLEGQDIGNRDVLMALGGECGLPPDLVGARLDSGADMSDVVAENTRAHAIGMSGVPGFIFGDRFAVTGAQEPAIFLRMLDLALETQVGEPVTNP